MSDKDPYSGLISLNFSSHKIPEFKEVKNKEWVYYGEHNESTLITC